MCIVAEGSNLFLKKNYAGQFENDIQVSKSEVKMTKKSKDGSYIYKILRLYNIYKKMEHGIFYSDNNHISIDYCCFSRVKYQAL